LAPGECAWDLYSGAGLFAAALAELVGPQGTVVAVE
jgi:tRNA/tmRNA/rRNA uracil-C5-methylase (TrmA/RlmC/RlmD family)